MGAYVAYHVFTLWHKYPTQRSYVRSALVRSRLRRYNGLLLAGVSPGVEHMPDLLLLDDCAVVERHHQEKRDVRWPEVPVERISSKIFIDAC